MKKIILPACVAIASILVACNDKIDGLDIVSSDSVTLKSMLDESRLINYTVESNVIFRSSDIVTAPAAPSIPSDAVNMLEATDMGWNSDNTNYYLPEGATYSEQIRIGENTNIYVAGDLTLSYYHAWGTTGANIYVLASGSITLPAILDDFNIESWGTSIFPDDFELNDDGSYANYNDDALFFGKLSIHGSFTTVSAVSATDLWINESGTSIFGSCITVENEFYAYNYSNIYMSSLLKAETIRLDSYANIFMVENSLVQCSDMTYNNDSHFVNQGSGYAVIDVDFIKIHNNTYLNRMSGGPIYLSYNTIEDDFSGNAIEWSANVVFEGDYYIAPTDCSDGYGEAPGSGDTDEEIVLEHVYEVTSPDIERISATGIDFLDGNVFVSWHEKEDPYQGYIDVVNMGDLVIEATYYTTELDFNHMYVTNSQIYVAGGNKNGALYSEVTYVAGSSSVEIDVVNVSGSSGNCILVEGTDKWVVSGANGGISVINSSDEVSYTELLEAKYVVKYGSNMAVLAGLTTTKVYEYSTSGEYVTEYEVGSIPTSDGKNTLFVDGDVIYVSLGDGGLKGYKNGSLVSELSSEFIGSVNCIDADDDYIYVANGVAGLYILDKTDMSVVKKYTLGDTSANFVRKGDDGLIYVAYGLDGVHAFKLSVI